MNESPGLLTSQRNRGLVWVCDIQNSTMYLNSDEKVDLFEEFIKRFYYLTCQITNAAGATHYKWTGDGFMAWFECELDRNVKKLAETIFEAAWQLSFLNNVTQFGIDFKNHVRIRHGVTYEKDGLHIIIKNPDGNETSDYIGRDVVLAFRVSSISVDFPSIITTSEIKNKVNIKSLNYMRFEKLELSDDEIKKYFKGEKHFSRYLYGTSKRIRYNRKTDLVTSIKNSKIKIENKAPSEFSIKYYQCFENGPDWAKEVGATLINFIRNELMGTFNKMYDTIITSTGSSIK